MKPLVYGYMVVSDDTQDAEIEQLERELRRFAEVEGFYIATVFYEFEPNTRAAFAELVNELKRAEAHSVVMPTLDHLATHPLLQSRFVEFLAREAEAAVFVLGAGNVRGSSADHTPKRRAGDVDATSLHHRPCNQPPHGELGTAATMQPDPFDDAIRHITALLALLLSDGQPLVWRARMADIVKRATDAPIKKPARRRTTCGSIYGGGYHTNGSRLLQYAKALPVDWGDGYDF